MIKILSVVLILDSMVINQYSVNAAIIDGIWFGTVSNTTETNHVTATLVADSTNFMYTVTYGENENPYHCGAYWLQTAATTFKEIYTYGTCSGDQVEFMIETNDTASYREWNQGQLGWAGLLTRRARLCP
jgi:hypothetical protein